MKKGKVLCMLVMSAVLLTGCVDAMPELTKEQSGMIAEYAASLLLKYSPNYHYKIVSEEEVAAAKAAEQELAETQTQEETDASEEQMDSENQQQIADETFMETGETDSYDSVMYLTSSDADIAAELGINDIIIKYQSYEICDSYPQNNSGFSVDAAQGKKLLIVHFDLQGSSDENVECNLFDYDLEVRMNVNGTTIKALSTMLPNELMSYMDTVPPAEMADVVAVAEINDLSETDIESLVLTISSNSGDCTIELK